MTTGGESDIESGSAQSQNTKHSMEHGNVPTPALVMPPHSSVFGLLSVEVILHIFSLCRSKDDPTKLVSYFFFDRTSKSAPALLSGVCRNWRRIVLSAPELWTEISLWAQHPDRLATHREVLRNYLARSAPLPFSFRLRGVLTDAQFSAYLPGVIDVLLPHAHRWEWVNIDMRIPPKSLSCFSSVTAGALKSLRAFNLNLMGSYREVDAHLLAQWLASLPDTPLLRTVHLELTFSRLTHQDFPYPWGQVVEINLDGGDLTCQAALGVLGQCARLETCVLTVAGWRVPGSPSPLVEVPRLKRLTIRARTGLGPLLDRLVLPALVDLQIEGAFEEDPSESTDGDNRGSPQGADAISEEAAEPTLEDADHDSDIDSDDGSDKTDENLAPRYALIELLTRAPQLKSLKLDNIFLHKDRLVRCLRHSPGILALEIGYSGFNVPSRLNMLTHKFFAAFALPPTSLAPCLLPQLRHLHLNVYNQFPGDALLDMLESRCNPSSRQHSPVNPLQKAHVRFDYDCGLYQENWDRLDRLVEHGLVTTEGPEGDHAGAPERCVLTKL